MGFPRATTMVNGYASIADKGRLLKKLFGVDMAKLIFPFFAIEKESRNGVNKILGENAIIDGELARFYFFVSFQNIADDRVPRRRIDDRSTQRTIVHVTHGQFVSVFNKVRKRPDQLYIHIQINASFFVQGLKSNYV